MSVLSKIHEVQALSWNLAQSRALELYGSEATVLNRRIEDGQYIITIFDGETEGIAHKDLAAGISKPAKVIKATVGANDQSMSVRMAMDLLSGSKGLKENLVAEAVKDSAVETILHSIGFEPLFVSKVSEELLEAGVDVTVDSFLNKVVTTLAGGDDILSKGGWVSFIGSTGVGKTTTLSKLAALYSKIFGAQNVALVTVDTYRMGAVEQLRASAQHLELEFHVAESPEELQQLTKDLAHKRLVLLDTPGTSQKDKLLNDSLKKHLNGNIKNLLVINSSTQYLGIKNNIAHTAPYGIDGLILTKLDECQALGGAITAVSESGYPVRYITVGQEIPQDIELVDKNTLVTKACEMAGHKWVDGQFIESV